MAPALRYDGAWAGPSPHSWLFILARMEYRGIAEDRYTVSTL